MLEKFLSIQAQVVPRGGCSADTVWQASGVCVRACRNSRLFCGGFLFSLRQRDQWLARDKTKETNGKPICHGLEQIDLWVGVVAKGRVGLGWDWFLAGKLGR